MRARRPGRPLLTLVTLVLALLAGFVAAPAALAIPGLPDGKDAPTPEVPGRGVVGFFDSAPDEPPPPGDPFARNATTTIYEQYGYAGLRWHTYDLGVGPDIARSPDAAIGTSVSNWLFTFPKAAVAATGAVVGAAFRPDFLGVFDPLVTQVVDTLRRTVFEQWVFLVIAALGLLLIWRSRHASLASSTGAVGWALLVLVLATMVFRWPLVAGEAADTTVTTTMGAVSGGLNGQAPGSGGNAAVQAVAGMQEALLYQAWLGGTFGDANSEVARRYGPDIFTSQALTWREAEILREDPDRGQRIIEEKKQKFEQTAEKIKAEDPDAYEYLTGRRSDTRVGYALLAGFATLCAVPFLIAAGLLVLGALIIVRFGVMLFPAFATLGLFPTMRSLVTGVGNTMAAALINAIIFGIGASVTVRGMGVILAPATGLPPWLDVVLVLLLTIVMWVALRPFRRLSSMVSRNRNHFGAATGGVGSVTRGVARTTGRILTTAFGTFLGVSAANKNAEDERELKPSGVPQRAEAVTSYLAPEGGDGAGGGTSGPATLTGPVTISAPTVTVTPAAADDDVFAPSGRSAGAGAGAVAGAAAARGGASARAEQFSGDAGSGARREVGGRFESGGAGAGRSGGGSRSGGRGGAQPARAERREPYDLSDYDFDELTDISRPDVDRTGPAPRRAPASPAVVRSEGRTVEAGRGR